MNRTKTISEDKETHIKTSMVRVQICGYKKEMDEQKFQTQESSMKKD
jgi:hypothetical protein